MRETKARRRLSRKAVARTCKNRFRFHHICARAGAVVLEAAGTPPCLLTPPLLTHKRSRFRDSPKQRRVGGGGSQMSKLHTRVCTTRYTHHTAHCTTTPSPFNGENARTPNLGSLTWRRGRRHANALRVADARDRRRDRTRPAERAITPHRRLDDGLREALDAIDRARAPFSWSLPAGWALMR